MTKVYLPFILIPLLFISALQSRAQYAGVPGTPPPLPDSSELDVAVSPPFESAFGIPGITDERAGRLENPDEDEIIYRGNGVTIARFGVEYQGEDITYIFTGDWGLNIVDCVHCASVSQLSPSGKYYAVGADGTGTSRGPVFVIDLETGEKYCTTPSDVWDCSNWIEGDYLLIESCGGSDSLADMWRHDELISMPWINYSYMTESEGRSSNIVLYHDGTSLMILPEDRYYNYRMTGIPDVFENGITFDVTASPNVVPSLIGLDTRSDFTELVDSLGYETVFPVFDFSVYVDTQTGSVTNIRPDSS